jgi:hypothetical protein
LLEKDGYPPGSAAEIAAGKVMIKVLRYSWLCANEFISLLDAVLKVKGQW